MAQGILLSGEFVAIERARSYTRRDGTEVEPVKLKLLAGSSVFSVEYQSMADALAAMGGSALAKGTPVFVPVYVSGPFDPSSRRRGPVFFQGRRIEGVASEAVPA